MKSANAAGVDSTFAGALKNADPKPARKSTSSKAAGGGPTGDGLPAVGNHPPPQPATMPQADVQAGAARQVADATVASGVNSGVAAAAGAPDEQGAGAADAVAGIGVGVKPEAVDVGVPEAAAGAASGPAAATPELTPDATVASATCRAAPA
jgi:hypothetical protein